MKKFLTMLFTLAVACSLSLPVFAQTGGGSTDQKEDTTTGKKDHKAGKKGHKGGKKSKKGSTGTDTTPPPK
jgi:hypothetical protein